MMAHSFNSKEAGVAEFKDSLVYIWIPGQPGLYRETRSQIDMQKESGDLFYSLSLSLLSVWDPHTTKEMVFVAVESHGWQSLKVKWRSGPRCPAHLGTSWWVLCSSFLTVVPHPTHLTQCMQKRLNLEESFWRYCGFDSSFHLPVPSSGLSIPLSWMNFWQHCFVFFSGTV